MKNLMDYKEDMADFLEAFAISFSFDGIDLNFGIRHANETGIIYQVFYEGDVIIYAYLVRITYDQITVRPFIDKISLSTHFKFDDYEKSKLFIVESYNKVLNCIKNYR